MIVFFFLFQVAKSNRIVVIGGGAVGVELVGELASDYPNKKVTLMHHMDKSWMRDCHRN